jgi:hypothetical protein
MDREKHYEDLIKKGVYRRGTACETHKFATNHIIPLGKIAAEFQGNNIALQTFIGANNSIVKVSGFDQENKHKAKYFNLTNEIQEAFFSPTNN